MKLRLTTLAVACLLVGQAIANDNLAWVTDKAGYTGSVTRYNTLADAQNHQNGQGTYTVQQRDAGTFFVNGRPDVYTNSNIFLTAWYYSTSDNTNGLPKDDPGGDRYYSGWGNPNNTDNSFVQLYDGDGSTYSSMTGGWTSNAHDTFNIHVVGGNANFQSRLWNAGNPDIGGEGTKGSFVSYDINMTASGLVGLADGSYYTATNHPADVSGTFSGIFLNTSVNSPSSDGYYGFTLNMNNTNWAYAQGDDALNGNFGQSYFSGGVVPEPASMLALSGFAFAALRRRKTKN